MSARHKSLNLKAYALETPKVGEELRVTIGDRVDIFEVMSVNGADVHLMWLRQDKTQEPGPLGRKEENHG